MRTERGRLGGVLPKSRAQTIEDVRRLRLYETILSNTADLVYVFDLNSRLIYANRALLAIWRLNAQEAIGRSLPELGYPLDHAATLQADMNEAVSSSKLIRGVGLFAGAGKGIYDYVFIPVLDEAAAVESIAGSARDVTEAQRTEAVLRESDRQKEDFISLLAHELRNPLAPLMNGLQIMKLSEDDPKQVTEVRQLMDRQLSHLVRLIDDLLDVSRLTRHRLELRRRRVFLGEVVTDAVQAVSPAVEEKQHNLNVLLPATPVCLDADPTRLSQVLVNLLVNSAKFTRRGGEISLTAEVSGHEVSIEVKDNGRGIAQKDLTSIFDMFAQAGGRYDVRHGGLGLGLALVKGLVEMHGGSVWAESNGRGKGSTFTVRLPIASENEAPLPRAVTDWSPRGGPRRRVLVVDDNADLAASTAMMLSLLGHDVLTAADGVEALRAADRYHPDVVLMDIGMPRLDGLEATRRLKRKPWAGRMKIIALTGWGQERDRRDSELAGCDAHLVKPVRLAELDNLLGEL